MQTAPRREEIQPALEREVRAPAGDVGLLDPFEVHEGLGRATREPAVLLSLLTPVHSRSTEALSLIHI